MLPLAGEGVWRLPYRITGLNSGRIDAPKSLTLTYNQTKGSGLRLATSFSIVKKSRGDDTCEIRAKAESTFYIYLPAIRSKTAGRGSSGCCPWYSEKGKSFLWTMEDCENGKYKNDKDLGMKLRLQNTEREEAIENTEEGPRLRRPFDSSHSGFNCQGGMGGQDAIQELLRLDSGIKSHCIEVGLKDACPVRFQRPRV